ncbi:hypothetical protein P9112_009642 [Eukaryota sp. TZLM1-RC]
MMVFLTLLLIAFSSASNSVFFTNPHSSVGSYQWSDADIWSPSPPSHTSNVFIDGEDLDLVLVLSDDLILNSLHLSHTCLRLQGFHITVLDSTTLNSVEIESSFDIHAYFSSFHLELVGSVCFSNITLELNENGKLVRGNVKLINSKIIINQNAELNIDHSSHSEYSLMAWGDGRHGRTGTGDASNPHQLLPVNTDEKFEVIEGGFDHTLALTSEGILFAWGRNNYGQLGLGSVSSVVIPTEVVMMTKVVQISASYDFSLVLTVNGDVYSFGDNWKGNLGHGDTSSRSTPTKIDLLSDVVDVSAGSAHGLAITSNGDVFVWGQNYNGQLGLGTFGFDADEHSPIPISIEPLRKVIGCRVVSMFITINDELLTAGRNDHGQLCVGDFEDRHVPGNIVESASFQIIEATCGLNYIIFLSQEGDVYSCGAVLGRTGISHSPGRVENLGYVTSIFRGDQIAFALNIEKKLFSWTSSSSSPDLVIETSEMAIENVFTGWYHFFVDENFEIPRISHQGSSVVEVEGKISNLSPLYLDIDSAILISDTGSIVGENAGFIFRKLIDNSGIIEIKDVDKLVFNSDILLHGGEIWSTPTVINLLGNEITGYGVIDADLINYGTIRPTRSIDVGRDLMLHDSSMVVLDNMRTNTPQLVATGSVELDGILSVDFVHRNLPKDSVISIILFSSSVSYFNSIEIKCEFFFDITTTSSSVDVVVTEDVLDSIHTFYLSPNGINDECCGPSTYPCLSVSKIMEKMGNSGTIILKEGVYNGTNFDIDLEFLDVVFQGEGDSKMTKIHISCEIIANNSNLEFSFVQLFYFGTSSIIFLAESTVVFNKMELVSQCANDEPLITLVKSNVDFDDVVIVGCQSQSIVATDSTIGLETVLVRDSTATDGHFELTKTTLTMNNANFQGLEGKVFNIQDNTKVTGTNVGISDSNSNSDDLIVINNSDLTLTTVDLSDTKFSNIIDSKTSTITITDFDIVHHESNTGSFINADDSTFNFTNVKTLGPVDSDNEVISGCANDEPLITLVKSKVDFDEVVVVGCQSQFIVATNSTIDLETVLVRDSTASNGHFELTNSNFKATDVEFKNLEGKVFDVKSDSKVEGLNVKVIDTTTNNDPMMITDSSTIDLKQTEIINSCVRPAFESIDSTIKIDDLTVSHPNTYSGSLFDASSSSELTLDNINIVKESTTSTTVTCSFTDPLFTVDNSEVTLADSSLIGHLSQFLVGINNADVTFTNVDVLDSEASGHVELTNSNFTATDVEFNNLEGKVFDVKSDSKIDGLRLQILNIDTPSEALLKISSSKVTLIDSQILDSSVFRLIDSISKTEISFTNLDIIDLTSYSGSFINADESTMDFTKVKTLGPVDSDGKVISGCANDEPLITLVKSNVDFDDVVVVGCQSQSIVATDSTIDLEAVLVRDSTATDGHFELTNSNLKARNVFFQNLFSQASINIQRASNFQSKPIKFQSNFQSKSLLTADSSVVQMDTFIIDNCHFDDSINYINDSVVSLSNFSNNANHHYHGFYFIESKSSQIDLVGLVFNENLLLKKGVVKSFQSDYILNELVFANSNVPLFNSVESNLEFYSCTFDNVTLSDDYSALEFHQSKILLQNSSLTNFYTDFNNTVPLLLCSGCTLLIKECTVADNYGVLIHCINGSTFELEQSTFKHNESPLSPIILEQSTNSLLHNYNVFESNIGSFGGCISVFSPLNFICEDNLFINSFATHEGGSLYIQDDLYNFNVTINNNSFIDNQANRAGGAMFINFLNFVHNFNESFIDVLSNNFHNCMANQWGNDVATNGFALSLAWMEADSTALNRTLVVAIMDYFKQLIIFDEDYSNQLEFSIKSNVSVEVYTNIIDFSKQHILVDVVFQGPSGTYILLVDADFFEQAGIEFSIDKLPNNDDTEDIIDSQVRDRANFGYRSYILIGVVVLLLVLVLYFFATRKAKDSIQNLNTGQSKTPSNLNQCDTMLPLYSKPSTQLPSLARHDEDDDTHSSISGISLKPVKSADKSKFIDNYSDCLPNESLLNQQSRHLPNNVVTFVPPVPLSSLKKQNKSVKQSKGDHIYPNLPNFIGES